PRARHCALRSSARTGGGGPRGAGPRGRARGAGGGGPPAPARPGGWRGVGRGRPRGGRPPPGAPEARRTLCPAPVRQVRRPRGGDPAAERAAPRGRSTELAGALVVQPPSAGAGPVGVGGGFCEERGGYFLGSTMIHASISRQRSSIASVHLTGNVPALSARNS